MLLGRCSTVIFIAPGALWASYGRGSPRSPVRVLPAVALCGVGGFIFLTGTGVTIKQIVDQGGLSPSSSQCDGGDAGSGSGVDWVQYPSSS